MEKGWRQSAAIPFAKTMDINSSYLNSKKFILRTEFKDFS